MLSKLQRATPARWHELDRYLGGRAVEMNKELPLILVENQQYIHDNKGSLVMYTLREYLGEDAVNRALAAFIEKTKFQQPPFTNSLEFLEEIRAVTPEKYAYLVRDLFETITLYDNRALSAKSRPLGNGSHALTLEVHVGKYRADADGAERPVQVDDWIQIAVFGDDAPDAEPIYQQLHQLTDGTHTLELEVDREPVRAGIDPNILLIDRGPDDNVTRVR